jgi:hypothetical protein
LVFYGHPVPSPGGECGGSSPMFIVVVVGGNQSVKGVLAVTAAATEEASAQECAQSSAKPRDLTSSCFRCYAMQKPLFWGGKLIC